LLEWEQHKAILEAAHQEGAIPGPNWYFQATREPKKLVLYHEIPLEYVSTKPVEFETPDDFDDRAEAHRRFLQKISRIAPFFEQESPLGRVAAVKLSIPWEGVESREDILKMKSKELRELLLARGRKH